MDLDTGLDPFWSADPAWAGAAWAKGENFASINRMTRIKTKENCL